MDDGEGDVSNVSAVLQDILGIDADCAENPMYVANDEVEPSLESASSDSRVRLGELSAESLVTLVVGTFDREN